jgi:hypothetical protein
MHQRSPESRNSDRVNVHRPETRASRTRASFAHGAILDLQRRVGNAAVVRALLAARQSEGLPESPTIHTDQAASQPVAAISAQGRDERVGEVNSRHALHQRPADREEPAPPGSTEPIAPAPKDIAIQRKIGFEFETGWWVDTAKEEKRFGGITKKYVPDRPLKKHDRIGPPFDGFRLEADIATQAQRSDVEFIVDPPVEEGAEGEQHLRGVMTRLTEIGRRMERAAKKIPADREKLADLSSGKLSSFLQEKATGRVQDRPFIITPEGPLGGGPQVTSGLALRAIPRLGEPLAAGSTPGAANSPALELPKEMKAGAQTLRVRAGWVEGNDALPAPSQELKGLVAVIASYVIRGATDIPPPYAKQLAGLIMARTDFGRLFQLLPENEQKLLKADQNLWVDLVIRTASKNPTTQVEPKSTDPLFRVGVGSQGKPVDLTIEQWLEGMLENKDLLPEKTKTDMGAMGDKVEGIGPGAKEDAGIFEYRQSQLTKIPLGSWAEFALQTHKYITRLHAEGRQG